MNTEQLPDAFVEFPKMARLSREIIISEKIDGTNAQILIYDAGDGIVMKSGSRTRWLSEHEDNFGFFAWSREHADELLKLGVGRHFGEWWGSGIQRGYGLQKGEKRFSLFNTTRWCLHGQIPKKLESADPTIVKHQDILPACVGLVPELYRGEFTTEACSTQLERLRTLGSVAAPGFMKPEGIIIFHTAGNVGFKKTINKDDVPKSRAQ